VKSVSPNNKGFPHFRLFTPIFKNKFSYIPVIDKASAFKIAKTLRFTKAHHKIPRRRKVGVAMG